MGNCNTFKPMRRTKKMVDTAAKEYRKTNTSRTEKRKCESLDTKSMNIIKKNNPENRCFYHL